MSHDGIPLERARTLLVHGATLRRVKRKRAARESLERASAIFRELEASAWERQAAAELDRLGLRPSDSPLALTPTEERVAQLVASGLSNQQVAATMSLSIRTVESNLTRVYRKLGVKRRPELVRMSGPRRRGRWNGGDAAPTPRRAHALTRPAGTCASARDSPSHPRASGVIVVLASVRGTSRSGQGRLVLARCPARLGLRRGSCERAS